MEKNIKQKVDKKEERLIEIKEAKLNALKTLRKMSTFTKGNFEDIVEENLELKKTRILNEMQIKLLKVKLVKEVNKNKKFVPVEDFSDFGEKFVGQKGARRVENNENSMNSNEDVSKKGNWKKNTPKVTNSATENKSNCSASTRSSLSVEALQQELLSLKKQMAEKEHNFKVQMGRMKTFYDKHLEELNLTVLKKKEPEKVVENISKETEKEKALRSLRKKAVDNEEEKRKLTEIILEKETVINDLRSRIANQGFTKLSKIIEDQKEVIRKKDETISAKEEEARRVGNLEYQLETNYEKEGPEIRWIVQKYLFVRRVWSDQATESMERAFNWVVDLVQKQVMIPVLRLAKKVWVYLSEKLIGKGADMKEEIEKQMKRWKKEEGSNSEQVMRLRGEIETLKEKLGVCEDVAEERKKKLDLIVRMGGDYRQVLSRGVIM